MEDMYLADLDKATELVLNSRSRTRPAEPPPQAQAGGYGSAGRATTGMLRIGNAVGAAIKGDRELGPIEARLLITAGLLVLAAVILIRLWPGIVVYPALVLSVWLGAAFLYNGWLLYRERRRQLDLSAPNAPTSARAEHR